MWLCFLHFASSHHHHLDMNFYYIFLLLVVLSSYPHSPQYGEPPDLLDPIVVIVYPNSNSDPWGVLAPILPQSEVFGSGQYKNMVLPQNKVYKFLVLPQNEVYKIFVLPLLEFFFWTYKGPFLLWPYKHCMHWPISLSAAS
jgi:hypothetical protein